MHIQRSLLPLAYVAALAACNGADEGTSAADDGATTSEGGTTVASTGLFTSSAGTTGATSTDATTSGPGTTASTTAPGTTEPGTTEPGTTEPGTTEGTTDPGTTTGTDTDTDTDTEGTTGVVECEPSWAIPEVPADALAAHDLGWIGCELLACGDEDKPEPGEPSVLCREFSLEGVPLEYLGHLHINETGVFTKDDVVSPQNIPWLDGLHHIYKYDQSIFLMVEGDEASDQLDVFFAVRALEILRADHPLVWERLIDAIGEFPAEKTLMNASWKNRLRGVIVSFDTSPQYIAAGLTILDTAPESMMNVDLYSNVLGISIDRETIRGSSDTVGSRPIYKKPGDDENFLRYLREGLVETLVHELLHPRVDRLNSVDTAMNELWNRRFDNQACARFELEEALVAASSLLHFREAGGVSDTYLDYYDVVLDANLAKVAECPDYPTWSQEFSIPSGVDPRYDLRLFDLE
ncbi:MAG: hypothetical protein R3B09_24670 [Nannocystaceae bacterium]